MIKVKLIKLITNDVTGYSLISCELGRQLKHHSYTGYVSILPIAFVAEARYTEIERCLDRKELLHNGPIKISFLVFYANQRLHGVVSKVCVWENQEFLMHLSKLHENPGGQEWPRTLNAATTKGCHNMQGCMGSPGHPVRVPRATRKPHEFGCG